jgi:RNA polymerase sigma factor (TIGR02999 family)
MPKIPRPLRNLADAVSPVFPGLSGVPMSEVTQVLSAIEQGDPRAAEQLLPLVYAELRMLAARKLAQEKPGQTLQATALVHEAYLRVVGGDDKNQQWDSRRHFFAAAAEAMRRILIDQARRKQSAKAGGALQRVPLDEGASLAPDGPPREDLLALHEALRQLDIEDPIKAQLVNLRFFAGVSLEDAAGMLGISPATAKRYWIYARSWLYGKLQGE